MLIGIDASRANRQHKTGVEWYAFHLIKNLAKIDKENCYLLYTPEPLQPELADLGENFQECVLHWPLSRFWTQARISWEMMRNPPNLLFIPSYILPFIHPPRNVVAIHDVAFKKILTVYSWRGRHYLEMATIFNLKHASKIIVPSQSTKNDILQFYPWVNAQKIFVTYLGCAENFQLIDDQAMIRSFLEKYQIKQPFFLYLGRIEKKKNVNNIVKAFWQLQQKGQAADFQLVLAGPMGFGGEEVAQAVRRYNLEAKIKFLDWIEQKDLPILYNTAFAFVFPSLYEGFGLPVVEAMACGTPVIASTASCLPEIVGDAGILVDPLRSEEIAVAMQRLIQDRELREKLQQAGLQRAKEFSWEKCARQTLAVFNSVV